MTSGVRANLLIAIVLGGATAALTLMLGHTDISFFVFALIPGLIGSMAVAGNVHAFSLGLGACFNFLFYFLLSWAVGSVIRTLRSRRHQTTIKPVD